MKTVSEILGGRRPVVAMADEPVRQAVRRMVDNHIGALPVLDGERVVGIFTERDLMKRIVDVARDPEATRVRDVMTADGLATIGPDEAYHKAVRRMKKARCRHILVVDQGRLVGVVGLRDLLEMEFSEAKDELDMLHAYIWYVPPELTVGN